MEMNQNNEKYEYTYSSIEQEEVRKIREKYIPKEEDKLTRLQKLDNSATNKATMVAIIIGVISALIMGTGMSFCMVWTDTLMIPGIIIGIIGMVGIGLAYPVYNIVLKNEREKIAPEVIRLSEELMK